MRKKDGLQVASDIIVAVLLVLAVFVTGVQIGIWWHRTNIKPTPGAAARP